MNKARELEDLIRGKWFEPIIRDLESFEDNAEVFEEATAVAEPNSPDWGIKCVLKATKPFAQHLGWPIDGKFTARNVGAMLGAKVSISSGMVNSYRWSQTWKPEIRTKLVEFWGKDDVEGALKTWKKFSDCLHPKIQTIRRKALTIAAKQTLLEDLEFSAGIAKGLSLLPELQKLAKKSTKAAVRAHKRGAVIYSRFLSLQRSIHAEVS